ncbi:hypothetical protein FHS07_003291 [Microbacterium proteolyticum]|uniref:Uncharacterized protein n=1 Tax=Microbacterium proteolyticum TaxID=1572644 RepID=A0A7W5CKV1_9MICO|nr:hypothetical protein [Microbacterium proteolyticum]
MNELLEAPGDWLAADTSMGPSRCTWATSTA